MNPKKRAAEATGKIGQVIGEYDGPLPLAPVAVGAYLDHLLTFARSHPAAEVVEHIAYLREVLQTMTDRAEPQAIARERVADAIIGALADAGFVEVDDDGEPCDCEVCTAAREARRLEVN